MDKDNDELEELEEDMEKVWRYSSDVCGYSVFEGLRMFQASVTQ